MNSDIAIRVENLSKVYRIGINEQRHETLLGAATAWFKSPLSNFNNLRKLSHFDDIRAEDGRSKLEDGGPISHPPTPVPSSPSDVIWALKDVSFEIKHGEAVGIIGRNGAGKSTLLKILSRITEPTFGRVEVFGRVASLLEVGTGFHPDLTGRENIYLNGTILGMKRREIDVKFDEIVDFSGVEKFIDTPVKRYSSGMRVRLAFSVAAHLEPEILIIDEVLAVGDAEFQQKCLGKMESVSRQGRTVLFVSHQMAAVANLCTCAVWIESGKVVGSGNTNEIINNYSAGSSKVCKTYLDQRVDREGNGEVRFTDLKIYADGNDRESNLISGGKAIFEASYRAKASMQELGRLSVSIIVSNIEGQNLFCLWDKLAGRMLNRLPPCGILTCQVERLPLVPGRYRVMLTMVHDGNLADRISFAGEFTVVEGNFFGTGKLPEAKHGSIMVEHEWDYVEKLK